MILQIPLQPVPSQTLNVVLSGQNCIINVYLKTTGIFVDVTANNALISSGVIAHDAVPLVPTAYLGFVGNLMFIDTQGNSDPTFDGLGSRYQLLYSTAVGIV